ncbi:MAG: YjiH family protein [Ruminococcaceae bacterium]|jgi:nucleoside recognition membrane protein YjiH|nr:YjiH family protein [Oscillospiraceae bacterium]
MKDKGKLKAMFLIPSIIGVLIFMIPMPLGPVIEETGKRSMTVIVKVIADWLKNDLIGYNNVAIVCLFILTVSAVLALVAQAKPKFIEDNKLLKDCFGCAPIWAIIRVIGCICVWLTYLFGEDFVAMASNSTLIGMIAGADEGELAYDLIIGLVFVFLVASFLLPLLTDFGLLEYIGALLTKFMRPVFKVPGRAAVDCVTSWIGDGTLGVMLTCNQYEGGYYSAKEASIIATLFSAVSITFSLTVLAEVGLTHMFGVYYLLICFVGIICALICARIWPLNKKPETYLVEGKAMPDELPAGYKSSSAYGMDLALKRVAEHKGIGEFFGNGLKNCLNMWFGVLPTVMAVGTVALVIADYTPVFDWLGLPFLPLLQVLGVPEAKAAASTMVIGFTDMFTPAILIASCEDAMTRFIVAVISITQVLFLDEVGGLIISSKLPVNLGELFVIFLERTIISILIVVPIAHLLF